MYYYYRKQEKGNSLRGDLKNHKEVAFELQRKKQVSTGRHYRMKDPGQRKYREQKQTCEKGQNKDTHPPILQDAIM